MLIPKGLYKGQKLIKLVIAKMIANISKMIPKVPLIEPVKYRINIMAAAINLITLSIVPIFFFMVIIFNVTQIEIRLSDGFII